MFCLFVLLHRLQSGFKRAEDDTLTIRQQRVGRLLYDGLVQVLSVDFEHDKIPKFLIDHVGISVDMRRAKVLWSSEDSPDKIKSFFKRENARIRRLLTERVQLKFSPTVEFVHTDIERNEARVAQILAQEDLDSATGGSVVEDMQ